MSAKPDKTAFTVYKGDCSYWILKLRTKLIVTHRETINNTDFICYAYYDGISNNVL